jgi:Homeodomain-like domain
VANKKFIVRLSNEERERLKELISKGKAAAKLVLKARILLKADQSDAGPAWSDEKICQALDTNIAMVTRVRSRLVNEGLDAVFARKKRRRHRPRRFSTANAKPS